VQGLLASLGINQHALRWMFGSAEASSSFQLRPRLPSGFQDSRTICKSFIAKSLLRGLHKRACVDVCAFFAGSIVCIDPCYTLFGERVRECMSCRLVASAHTFCECLAAGGAHADKSMACVNSRHTLLTCTHVCAVYSFSVGEQGWGSSTCSWLALVSGVGSYVLKGVEIGVLSYIFFLFLRGLACMRVYVCGCAHTHTYSVWVLGM